MHEGDPTDHVLVLLSGWVRVYTNARTGRWSCSRCAGPVTSSATSPRCRAGHAPRPWTRCRTRSSPSSATTGFLACLHDRPAVGIALLRQMAVRLRDAEAARVGFATMDVAQRVAALLVRLADMHGSPSTGRHGGRHAVDTAGHREQHWRLTACRGPGARDIPRPRDARHRPARRSWWPGPTCCAGSPAMCQMAHSGCAIVRRSINPFRRTLMLAREKTGRGDGETDMRYFCTVSAAVRLGFWLFAVRRGARPHSRTPGLNSASGLARPHRKRHGESLCWRRCSSAGSHPRNGRRRRTGGRPAARALVRRTR